MNPATWGLWPGLVLAVGTAVVPPLAAQGAGKEQCGTATETDPRDWLGRAVRAAVGSAPSPLRLRTATATSQNFQSDRTYPPYLFAFERTDLWYDPATGVERVTGQAVDPFGERSMALRVADGTRTYFGRGDSLIAVPPAHRFTLRYRPLNAWAVLHDWRAAGSSRIESVCRYRDYPRLVLTREGAYGPERLYLDLKTALPVRLTRSEPDLLWGRVAVEYIYSNWVAVGDAQYPMSSFRLVDGDEESIRTSAALPVASDSVPKLALPPGPPIPAAVLANAPEAAPDTIRVGPKVFLLRTPSYTNVVTLLRDTVFILDAQTSEFRARADSAWIGRLFPGRHPLVLVVSDLAWPHIAGVRYWVANGATVVSHEASRDFLERVVLRRWTAEPDLLERRRAHVRFRFVAVEKAVGLAGGDLRIVPIDGIGSEGSVMAYLPAERFLYAGDYVQRVDQPTAYAREVHAAVLRAGVTPDRLAAMHLPLTPWAALESVLAVKAGANR